MDICILSQFAVYRNSKPIGPKEEKIALNNAETQESDNAAEKDIKEETRKIKSSSVYSVVSTRSGMSSP